MQEKKLNLVYTGETKKILKYRLVEHGGYVTNAETSQATCEHFNMPGHSLADLLVTIIEQKFRKKTQNIGKNKNPTLNEDLIYLKIELTNRSESVLLILINC